MPRRKRENGDNPAKIGHNSNLTADQKRQMGGYIRSIEQLEQSKSEIAADISEIYKSAKNAGFDPKAMRHLLKLRRMGSAGQREEFENSVDAYKLALGMLAGTPLGDAAVARDFADPPFGAPPEAVE